MNCNMELLPYRSSCVRSVERFLSKLLGSSEISGAVGVKLTVSSQLLLANCLVTISFHCIYIDNV